MFSLRAQTLMYAADFVKFSSHGVKDGKAVKVGGVTSWIWTAFGLVGALIFVASFGVLLVPFFMPGALWLNTVALFVAAQWTAQIFMDIHETWVKAAAFFWIVTSMFQKKKPAQMFTKDITEATSPDAYRSLNRATA